VRPLPRKAGNPEVETKGSFRRGLSNKVERRKTVSKENHVQQAGDPKIKAVTRL